MICSQCQKPFRHSQAYKGQTPICFACRKNPLKCVSLLIGRREEVCEYDWGREVKKLGPTSYDNYLIPLSALTSDQLKGLESLNGTTVLAQWQGCNDRVRTCYADSVGQLGNAFHRKFLLDPFNQRRNRQKNTIVEKQFHYGIIIQHWNPDDDARCVWYE